MSIIFQKSKQVAILSEGLTDLAIDSFHTVEGCGTTDNMEK